MAIHSPAFLAFAALTLLLYYTVARERQNLLLLAASYIFYVTFSPVFVAILLVMTVVNYGLGLRIRSAARARPWLLAGIGFNVLVFLLFKSADFFVPDMEAFISRSGMRAQTSGLKLILPIGLSFYVLQAISYLVDLSRGLLKELPSPLSFALYLAYFPKLTAGPIERARPFLTALAKPREVDNDLLARSTTLLLTGLFRKIVIADTLLVAVPSAFFRNPASLSSLELIAWMAAYLFGLYNDFCGYSNIVRGASGFFGIELSRNFMHPFFSRSFSELWTRWHISLSLWLRDYIYFPLSRAIVRRARDMKSPMAMVLPPVVTMVASGLWHGPRAGFLLWGGLMGIYLGVENFVSSRRPILPPDRRPLWRQIGGIAVVVTCVSLSMALFLMGPVGGLAFFKGLAANSWAPRPDSRVFLLLLPSLLIDFVQHRRRDEFAFLAMPVLPKALVTALAVIAIGAFFQSKHDLPFIYQAF